MLGSLFLLSFHPFYEVQFFFINRIFKNDLISDCLCALNHVVGPIHKSEEGRGGGRPPGGGHRPAPGPSRAAGGRRGPRRRGGCSELSPRYTPSGRGLPIKRDPTCGGESPFRSRMKTSSYIISTFGAEVKPGPYAKLSGIN